MTTKLLLLVLSMIVFLSLEDRSGRSRTMSCWKLGSALAVLQGNKSDAASQRFQQISPALSMEEAELVMKTDREFANATKQRGLAGWLSYFADDATVNPTSPIQGKEALTAFYAHVFSRPEFSLSWKPGQALVFDNGRMASTIGRFESSSAGAKGEKVVATRGVYTTVWKKQNDGKWKVVADFGIPIPELKP